MSLAAVAVLPICKKVFGAKQTLERHFVKVHKIQDSSDLIHWTDPKVKKLKYLYQSITMIQTIQRNNHNIYQMALLIQSDIHCFSVSSKDKNDSFNKTRENDE